MGLNTLRKRNLKHFVLYILTYKELYTEESPPFSEHAVLKHSRNPDHLKTQRIKMHNTSWQHASGIANLRTVRRCHWQIAMSMGGEKDKMSATGHWAQAQNAERLKAMHLCTTKATFSSWALPADAFGILFSSVR